MQIKLLISAIFMFAFLRTTAQNGITWTNVVNLTITGDVLRKHTSTTGYNAGAISLQSFLADGAVEFKFLTPRYVVVGLTPHNTSLAIASIIHGIYAHINGDAYICENGAWVVNSAGKPIHTPYTANDVFSVERTNGVVRYKKNGNVFYTSAIPSTGPLHVDCSFSLYNATIEVTKFTLPLTWTGALNEDWNQAQNWSQNRMPNNNDLVFVNACTVCPTLNSNVTIAGIQLNTGAKVKLETRTLTVSKVTTIIGSTVESNSGKIVSKDFVDIKNSTFKGKIVLEKSGGSVNNCYGGNTFSPELQVINSSSNTLQLNSQASNVITGL